MGDAQVIKVRKYCIPCQTLGYEGQYKVSQVESRSDDCYCYITSPLGLIVMKGRGAHKSPTSVEGWAVPKLATLNMICSITYYLDLRNAISTFYCVSHILPTNAKLVVWTS